WPQVPTAAKVIAGSARSRLALGVRIIALLPPSSSKARPSRAPTALPTALPIGIEPVAETSGRLCEVEIDSPVSRRPMTTGLIPAGTHSVSAITSFKRFWHDRAQNGAFSEGFHTSVSPQTSASAAFQAHTATGKL